MLFRRLFSNYKILTNTIIFLICCLYTGSWSVLLGEDINWDLKNYHFYNPYAFLNDKLSFDYAPAMIQTYNNPLVDFFNYWLIQNFKPIQVGFIIGAMQGLNLFILYLIIKKMFAHYPVVFKEILIVAACIMGFYAAGNMSEIGTTFGDNIVSLFVLFPLFLLINHIIDNYKEKIIDINFSVLIFAGLIMGMGVGIKLTIAIYPIAFVLAMAVLAKNFWKYIQMSFTFSLSVFAGFILSIGYWMLILWDKFQNPLFPYFNKFFKSPYYSFANFTDKRFLPDDILQTLFYPFYFTRLQNYTSEFFFKDKHLTLCYIMIICFIVFVVYKFIRGKKNQGNTLVQENPNLRISLFIISFYVLSYIFWQSLFSIYRYIVVLEFLSPLLVFVILDTFSISKKFAVVIFVIISYISYSSVVTMDWGRLPWTDSYFGVEVPKVKNLEKSNIIIGGHEPIAYIVPFFPKTTRFLRVEGNMSNLRDTTKFQEEIKYHIDHAQSNYILLYGMNKRSIEDFQQNFSVTVDSTNCTYFKTRLDKDLCLCAFLKNN
jgi:hypothetical protein